MSDPQAIPGIHQGRVSAWLAAHVPGVRPPLQFTRIVGGHSNLTFKVTDAHGGAWVLRRPPIGPLLATAHDMAREHRIIAALGATDVPVPRALALCEDQAINDAPFYVMSFVDGYVLEDAGAVERLFPPAERRRIGESVTDVLAKLHAVDPDAIGLGSLGKKEDYLKRQLKRWRTQWEGSKTRELPAMEAVARALEQRLPDQLGATIVHGDYRLGNMITSRDARIAAVLDWELCTLGDPLADLGYVLNNWVTDPAEDTATNPGANRPPTTAPGFPSRAELCARYAELTGREVSGISYYRAFQYWRSAAIVEGVLDRYLKGKMAGQVDTALYARRVEGLAHAAELALSQGAA